MHQVSGSISLSASVSNVVASEEAASTIKQQVETELAGTVKKFFPSASPSISVHLTILAEAPAPTEVPEPTTTGINTTTGPTTTE